MTMTAQPPPSKHPYQLLDMQPYYEELAPSLLVCPRCQTKQSVPSLSLKLVVITLTAQQCMDCGELVLRGSRKRRQTTNGLNQYIGPYDRYEVLDLHPRNVGRAAKHFPQTDPEVIESYNQACLLFSAHAGASGAYARRTLEILLEKVGYAEKSLADSIKAAEQEADPDKKLPNRLLAMLGYVREIGNFALHVRRDGELSIVEISSEQVSVCLELIEAMIDHLYVQPAVQFEHVSKLNQQLAAVSKPTIPLPQLLWSPPAPDTP